MSRRSDLKLGASFESLRPENAEFTITLIAQQGTKWLCRYPTGGQRWWSQSHIMKYYKSTPRKSIS